MDLEFPWGCPVCYGGIKQYDDEFIACPECGWTCLDDQYYRPRVVSMAEYHILTGWWWDQYKNRKIDYETLSELISSWVIMPETLSYGR